MRRCSTVLALTLLPVLGGGGSASSASALPADLPREAEHVYATVPDVPFRDDEGRELRLAALWDRRPIILTMVYASCALICPPYLSSLSRAVAAAGGAGERYDVVVLSLDPNEDSPQMAALARRHGLANAAGWHFGVARRADIDRLAGELGLWTRRDPEGRVLDHPAALAAIDRGVLLRLLPGSPVEPARLREVVRELGGELVPAYPLPSPGVVFRCFGFDAESGRTVFAWGASLLVLPALVMFGGTLWIFGRRPRAGQAPGRDVGTD